MDHAADSLYPAAPRSSDDVSTADGVRRRAWGFGLAIAVVAWVSLVCIGVKVVADYSRKEGPQGTAPAHFPASSTIAPTPGASTLVLFVHPKCPCSRATLSELNAVMNAPTPRVSAFVVFIRPNGVEPGWERTDTWNRAGEIPHTARIVDVDGAEARRFGALTSGQVVVYDPRGNLEFSGGITDSRGHAGDNVGRRAVLAALGGSASDRTHAVFGCPVGNAAEPGSKSN